MNLILKEIRAARRVNPSPRLDFSWKNIVQEQVDAEAFLEWARKPNDPALPIHLSEPPKREPLLRIVKGFLP